MKKARLFLLLSVIAFIMITHDQAVAQRRDDRPSLDIDHSISEMLREEMASPTIPANVAAHYQKLEILVKAMLQNHLPVQDILSLQEGKRIETMIRSGDYNQAAPAVAEAIRRLGNARQGGSSSSVKDDAIALQINPAPGQFGITAGSGLDADNFLWGTEVYPEYLCTIARDALNNILPVQYLKVRFQTSSFFTEDGKIYLSTVCLPSTDRCIKRYNLDDAVKLFRENGWSMIPMISHDHMKPVTTQDIERYVNFVDWFIARYKNDANIRYLELINAPGLWWKGTNDQLAELQNKVYERIKGKYPEILVGTPGFEYWEGTVRDDKSVGQIEYFLDKRANVRFDFWAFHGYPAIEVNKIALPPTRRAAENKYAGPEGILEIRKRLDSNGWSDRMIIDTEHVNVMSRLTPFISDDEDMVTAAYTVQELLIKRTLTINGRYVLGGIIPLKIGPRGSMGEFMFASMKPDGSPTRTVRAAGLLVSKLKEFHYAAHISGAFDTENEAWIEKFQAGNKELYVFFKPFKIQKGQCVELDGRTLNYTLLFRQKPALIALTGINGGVTYPAPNQSIVLEAVNAPQFLEVSYK